MRQQSAALQERWASLTLEQWATVVDEPDLGRMALTRLLVLRLTEVELHGTDLDLPGIDDWGDAFVDAALPLRVAWLPRFRSRPDADLAVQGTWRLTDGESEWLVTTGAPEPTHTIRGSRRDLLALLLGRPTCDPVDDAGLKRAFPGP